MSSSSSSGIIDQDGCAAPSSSQSFDFPACVDMKSLLLALQSSPPEDILSNLIPIRIILEDLKEHHAVGHDAEQLSTLCHFLPIHITNIITSTLPDSANDIIIFESIWILCLCTEYLSHFAVDRAEGMSYPLIKECLFTLLLPFLLKTLESDYSSSSSSVSDSAKHQIYQCIGAIASSYPEIAGYLINELHAFDFLCPRFNAFTIHTIEARDIPRLESTIKSITALTAHSSLLTPESIRPLIPFFAHAMSEPSLLPPVVTCLINVMPALLSSSNSVFYLPILEHLFQYLTHLFWEQHAHEQQQLLSPPADASMPNISGLPAAPFVSAHTVDEIVFLLFQFCLLFGIPDRQELRKPFPGVLSMFYTKSPFCGMISDRFFSESCQSMYFNHLQLFNTLPSCSVKAKAAAASISHTVSKQLFNKEVLFKNLFRPVSKGLLLGETEESMLASLDMIMAGLYASDAFTTSSCFYSPSDIRGCLEQYKVVTQASTIPPLVQHRAAQVLEAFQKQLDIHRRIERMKLIFSCDFDAAQTALAAASVPGIQHLYPLSGFIEPLESQIDALCYAKLHLVDLIRRNARPNFNGQFSLFKPIISSLILVFNRALVSQTNSVHVDAGVRQRLYTVVKRLMSIEFMDRVLSTAEERMEYKLLAKNALFILQTTEPSFSLPTASSDYFELFFDLFGNIQQTCTSGHGTLVDTALRIAIECSPPLFQRVLDSGNIGFAIRALISPCDSGQHLPHWPKLIHAIITRSPELVPLLFEKEVYVSLFCMLSPKYGREKRVSTVDDIRCILESIMILLRQSQHVDHDTLEHFKYRLIPYCALLQEVAKANVCDSHEEITRMTTRILHGGNVEDMQLLATNSKDRPHPN